LISSALLVISSVRPALAFTPAQETLVETSLAALTRDPFAEQPFRQLIRVSSLGGEGGLLRLVTALRAETARGDASLYAILGRLELELGQPRAAAADYEHALSLATQPRLVRSLAQALDQLGSSEAAIRGFERVLSTYTDQIKPEELKDIKLRLCVLYFKAYAKLPKQAGKASACFAEVKHRYPADQNLRRQIIDALIGGKAYREALAELAELEALVATASHASVDKGTRASRVALMQRRASLDQALGDWHAAGATLMDAFILVSKDPEEPDDRELKSRDRPLLADELVRLYQTNHALPRLLTETQALEKKAPAGAALVGAVYLAMAKAEPKNALKHRLEAVAAYERALADHRRESKAGDAQEGDRYLLKQIVAAAPASPERLRSLEALVALSPNEPWFQLDLVRSLVEAGRTRDALSRADRLRAGFDDVPTVLAELGRYLLGKKIYAAALPCFQRALELEPDEPDLQLAVGDTLLGLDRKTDAARSFWKLLGPRPGISDYRALIEVLRTRKLKDEVTRAYQEGAKLGGAGPNAKPEAKNDKGAQHKRLAFRLDYAAWLRSLDSLDVAEAECKAVRDEAQNAGDSFLRETANYELKQIADRRRSLNAR
jgi:predicted Zn-dependent protease